MAARRRVGPEDYDNLSFPEATGFSFSHPPFGDQIAIDAAKAARHSRSSVEAVIDSNNVTTLGWASFWSGLAQEMIYPLLPVFVVVALTSSKAKLGLVEGLLAVGATVARLISARALNRGSSPLRLTRGWYGLSLVSRPLMSLAPSLAAVGALRVADGLGKGGKEAPKDVLVAGDSKSATMGRSFGIQTLLDTLGSVAGPVIAGGLLLLLGHGESSLRTVFALSAIPAVIAAYFLWRAHDAPPQRSARVGGSLSRGPSIGCSARSRSSVWRTRATRCCYCGRMKPESQPPRSPSSSQRSTLFMRCLRSPQGCFLTALVAGRCC